MLKITGKVETFPTVPLLVRQRITVKHSTQSLFQGKSSKCSSVMSRSLIPTHTCTTWQPRPVACELYNLFSYFFVSPFFSVENAHKIPVKLFLTNKNQMPTLGRIVTGKEPEESDHLNRGLVLSDNVTKSSFRKWRNFGKI